MIRKKCDILIISGIVMLLCVLAYMFCAGDTYAADVRYGWPVTGKHNVTGNWGRESGHYHDYHYGIDIGRKKGTKVYAAETGKVIFAGTKGAYGKCVRIQHENKQCTLYAHLSAINTKKGRYVYKGDLVGKVGNTPGGYAYHLHFGIYKNAKAFNKENGCKASKITLNPLKCLKGDASKGTIHKVGFNLVKGSGKSTAINVREGRKFTIHKAPAREGYSFQGWRLYRIKDKNWVANDNNWKTEGAIRNNKKYNFKLHKAGSTFTLSYSWLKNCEKSNYVFVAAWNPRTYTISYDANGGTKAPGVQKRAYGNKISVSKSIPEKEGYSFLGWSDSRAGAQVKYKVGAPFNENIAKDVVLYAVWKQNIHTVTYDVNGGYDGPEAQTAGYGDPLEITYEIPKRDGFKCVGWSTDPQGKTVEYEPGSTIVLKDDETLYAVWVLRQ